MLPVLSSLRQCCQQKISLWPCYQPLPGLFLDLFVRTPLASYGTIGQRQRWTPMASYRAEWVNTLQISHSGLSYSFWPGWDNRNCILLAPGEFTWLNAWVERSSFVFLALPSPLRFSEITHSLVGFLTLLASVVSPSSSSYPRVGPVGSLLRCCSVVVPANRPARSWRAPFIWGIALSSGVQVFSCQPCAPLIKGVRCSSPRDVTKRIMLCVHFPFGSDCRFRGHPGFRGDPYPVPIRGSYSQCYHDISSFLRGFCCQPGVEGGYMTTSHHIHASWLKGPVALVPFRLPPGSCGGGSGNGLPCPRTPESLTTDSWRRTTYCLSFSDLPQMFCDKAPVLGKDSTTTRFFPLRPCLDIGIIAETIQWVIWHSFYNSGFFLSPMVPRILLPGLNGERWAGSRLRSHLHCICLLGLRNSVQCTLTLFGKSICSHRPT